MSMPLDLDVQLVGLIRMLVDPGSMVTDMSVSCVYIYVVVVQ